MSTLSIRKAIRTDPEHQARIAAHCARIEAELAEQIEQERRAIQRAREARSAISPPLNFAGHKPLPKTPKPERWGTEYWQRVIDKANALARNPGWSQ